MWAVFPAGEQEIKSFHGWVLLNAKHIANKHITHRWRLNDSPSHPKHPEKSSPSHSSVISTSMRPLPVSSSPEVHVPCGVFVFSRPPVPDHHPTWMWIAGKFDSSYRFLFSLQKFRRIYKRTNDPLVAFDQFRFLGSCVCVYGETFCILEYKTNKTKNSGGKLHDYKIVPWRHERQPWPQAIM